jgi:uncharacterized protein (DUF2062 family)
LVFKRRDRRPIWQIVIDFVYPRGGWLRAFEYVKHRVRRLPDTPEKISRGIWAGVFTTFSPFFGLHFLVAFVIARAMRGNVLAALMATFFGNPLTYVPIAATSLWFGHRILGMRPQGPASTATMAEQVSGAWSDLWHKFLAIFTPAQMEWAGLRVFYNDFFFPFMIGGLVPGIIAGTICYYLSVPLIGAYQKRRRNQLQAKLRQLGKKPENGTDAGA